MSEWINCDDEMPDASGHYLIVYGGNTREAYWSPREFDFEVTCWVVSNYSGEHEIDPSEIEYWMHLPEPPQ